MKVHIVFSVIPLLTIALLLTTNSSLSAQMQTTESIAVYDFYGRVTDPEGVPIPGAQISILHSPIVLYTDSIGQITVSYPGAKFSLVVTSPGFRTKEVMVTLQNFRVRLSREAKGPDDQVKMAYGTTTREKLTGAAHQINARELSLQSISNPLAAMIGRVAGVQITPVNGLPNGDVQVSVRGRNSILNTRHPLYVINGMPVNNTPLSWNLNTDPGMPVRGLASNGAIHPLNNIAPASIESITVLKDADATACYGARGANGVVLITTKSLLNPYLEVQASSGIGRITRTVPYLHTSQYLQMRREALKNDGRVPGASDYDLAKWNPNKYTDWQKAMMGGSAFLSDASINMGTGSALMYVTLSGNYHRETTVHPGTFDYERSNFLLGGGLASEDNAFRIDFQGLMTRDNSFLPQANLAFFSAAPPNAPDIFTPDGYFNWDDGVFDNPYAAMQRTYYAHTSNMIANFKPTIQLSQSLQFFTNAGFQKITFREEQPNPSTAVNPFPNSDILAHTYFTNSTITNWLIEPQLKFQKNIRQGALQVLASLTWQQENWEQFGVNGVNYSSNELLRQKSAAGRLDMMINSHALRSRGNAQWVNVHYSWKDKWLFNLTVRKENHTYLPILGPMEPIPFSSSGWYGAGGTAWIFSKESWLRDNWQFLSLGKLRASYGKVGNDQTSNYRFSASNPAWRQENVYKMDVALELGFWKDRVLVNTTYYRALSVMPHGEGTRIHNTGLEWELSAANILQKDFSWHTDINLTIPRNKLLAFQGIENTRYQFAYAVGSPLDILMGAKSKGVDPLTGVYQFEDLNADGRITYPQDYAYPTQVGPTLYGGMEHRLRYKNWQIDLLCLFVKQKQYKFQYVAAIPGPGVHGINQPVTVMDRWQKPGDRSNIQQFSQEIGTPAANAFQTALYSDQALEDASFFRLKSLSVSYQLPQMWLKKIHISNANLYVQGQNLFTITGYTGRDPETPSQDDIYPLLKIWTIGFKFLF